MRITLFILLPFILYSQDENFHIKLVPTNDTSKYRNMSGRFYAVYTCDNWKTNDTLKDLRFDKDRNPYLSNARYHDTDMTYSYLVNMNCKLARSRYIRFEEEKIKAKHKTKGEIYIK